MYKKYLKRLCDIFFALLFLIFLSPFMLVVSILILALMGWPVFFSQERPGLNEKIFKIIKFRSMANLYDKDGNLLPNHQRITKFGIILRKTSFDELPELFNILRGDMSFVGPRPLLIRYLPYYSEEEKRRHSVNPGLTGLAQAKGRNALSWEDKFRFDVWYVDHLSFALDLKILLLTLVKVVKRDGIDIDSYHTITLFDEYVKSKSNKN